MNERVTLGKNDSRFKSYLLGTFSKEKRAIPVQSLNVGTDQESVTFEVKEIRDLGAPSRFYVWLEAIRLESLGQLALVLFLTVAFFKQQGIFWNTYLLSTTFTACFLIHIAAHLLNDYIDHIKGFDRESPHSGSRILQKGWLTAIEVKNFSYFCLMVSAMLGLPAILTYPLAGSIALVCVSVMVLVFSSYKLNLVIKSSSEILTFSLYGPLLINGFSLAISGQTNWEIFLFSLVVGWSFSLIAHLKNLEQVIYDSKREYKNIVGRLGFFKGRVLISIWVVALCGFFVIHSYVQGLLSIPFLLLSIGSSVLLLLGISRSRLYHIKHSGQLRIWGYVYFYLIYLSYFSVYF